MLEISLRGFQFLHAALFLLTGFGFFIFWSRTRFWLPRYAHILAAIALIVGLWCASNFPSDAPLSKQGPATRFLFALILPAMVYFFFVLYGGQKEAYRHKSRTAHEIADLIERFLNGTTLYPHEWNDFLERSHPDKMLDSYRKRCESLSPRINCLAPKDPKAFEELRNMVQELRKFV